MCRIMCEQLQVRYENLTCGFSTRLFLHIWSILQVLIEQMINVCTLGHVLYALAY